MATADFTTKPTMLRRQRQSCVMNCGRGCEGLKYQEIDRMGYFGVAMVGWSGIGGVSVVWSGRLRFSSGRIIAAGDPSTTS